MKLFILFIATVITFGLTGCNSEDRDKAKAALHKASDQTVEKLGKALDTTKDKLKKASDDVKGALDDKDGGDKPE